MKKRKICSCILTLILILTCIPISSNGVATPKFLEKADTSISASASENNAALYATNKIKNKKYTISKQTGTYSTPIKIKIKAKKGYKIYYSLNGKFKAKKVIKSKKKKTITISSTKTLQIYAVKSSKKVTNKKLKAKAVKKCKNYTYTIQGQTNENSGDSINPSDNKNNLDNEKNNNAHDQDNPKQDIENDYNNPSEENTSTESTIENTPSTGTTEEATTMDLTIDQKDFSTEDESITLSGTYDGDIKKLTYKVVFGKSEEITNGNISYSENKWSLALNNLKIGENNITITATNQNEEKISKSVQVILEGLYEYSEDDIVTDEETGAKYIDNVILVFLKKEITNEEQKEIVKSVSGEIIGSSTIVNQLQIRVPNTNYNELKNIIEKLEKIDGIVCATVDAVGIINETASSNKKDNMELKYPADGETNYQQYAWWYDKINADKIPIYQNTKIDIGIVDSGFDYTHEDLNLINISKKELAGDHGTHVAGIIGALKNGIGINGITQNHKIYCYNRAEDIADYNDEEIQSVVAFSRIISGVFESVNHGAKVINLSCGASDITAEDRENFGKQWSASIWALMDTGNDFLLVAGAGNYIENDIAEQPLAMITKENCVKTDEISLQDILDKIIIVANAEYLDNGSYQLAYDSVGGDIVDIVAIGTNVFSCIKNGYDYMSGTSMATPMVTGAIAGIWEMDPTMTSKEVRDIVLGTANNIVTVNPDYPNASIGTRTTYPLLNIKGAVEKLYGTLSGQVLDENNTPIDNVTIEVYDEKDNTVTTLYTDENGDFSVTLPEEKYKIKFIKSGYGTTEISITVEWNKITALLDPIIMTTNTIGIQGNVVDDTGAPLSDVLVEVRKSNIDDVVTTATTDENGEYSITLENGGYNITFSKDGYDSATLNDIVVFNDVSKLDEVVMNLTDFQDDISFISEISDPDPNASKIYTINDLLNATEGDYVLANDLDLSTYNNGIWTPIQMTGDLTLDGNGHVIKNLNIPEGYDDNYNGLYSSNVKQNNEHDSSDYGYLCYSFDFKNIGLENVNIKSSSAGALIGGVYNNSPISGLFEEKTVVASIDNCYMTGNIDTDGEVGGLVGIVYSKSTSYNDICKTTLQVTNSFSQATIIGNDCAGGLIGEIESWNTFNNRANYGEIHLEVNNCFSNSCVKSTAEPDPTSLFIESGAGGIIGHYFNYNTVSTIKIENTSVMGDIFGESSGGIAGYIEFGYKINIDNCKINASIDSYVSSGGIIGYPGGGGSGTILEVNSCEVSGTLQSLQQVGGILGDGCNCYYINDCEVKATIKNSSFISSSNRFYAAGIVPWAPDGSINNCNMTGDFIINSDREVYLGGIVSYCGSADFKIGNCNFLGNLSLNISNEDSILGGIIGECASNGCVVTSKCGYFGFEKGVGKYQNETIVIENIENIVKLD